MTGKDTILQKTRAPAAVTGSIPAYFFILCFLLPIFAASAGCASQTSSADLSPNGTLHNDFHEYGDRNASLGIEVAKENVRIFIEDPGAQVDAERQQEFTCRRNV